MTGKPGQLEVQIAPIQQAFLDSGLSAAEIARRLGWADSQGRADHVRVKRRLGIYPCLNRRGGGRRTRSFTQSTTYERALEMVAAIGVDPVDCGL